MSKIIRKTGDVKAFGSNATSTNRTVFGAETQSDTLDDNVTAELLTGWQIVAANEKPTLQDYNAAGFTAGQYIAYLHQMGIAEWDGAQQYQINSFANRGGVIYRCKTADHTSATVPESDATNWASILSEVQAALNELDTDKLAKAGGTITGDLALDNGTTDTPQIIFNDPINNTQANIDLSNEHVRIYIFYRGGEYEIPFEINLDTLTATFGGNVAAPIFFSTAAQSTAVNALTRKDYVDSLQVISKEYESSEQTITSAGLLTLTHSLGAVPKIINYSLKCIGAEDGYSVGDIIDVYLNNSTNASNVFNSVIKTSTQIKFKFTAFNNCFIVGNPSNGNTATLDNSNWKLIVRAFA